MKLKISLLMSCLCICFSLKSQTNNKIDLNVITEFSLGSDVGALRAVPVLIGPNESAIFVSYSADKEMDPSIEMFFTPSDKLKFALFTLDGQLIWKKELGAGTINGRWFTPIFPFDLDNDGIDEIYFVNNPDSVHILGYKQLRLEALDSRTGKLIGQWPWKRTEWGSSLSHTFRNFIFGGYSNGEPILMTAQGTYGKMGLQAWDKGMGKRWDLVIEKEDPGARGSHMSPVVDIDFDGIDEILWGERCISIDDGRYLFIADENEYNGHSDVIQPTLNRATNKWSIFTCRESGDKGQIKPRVVMFNDSGQRIWKDLDEGHMDMGWTAHLDNSPVSILAFTISIGAKVAGSDGFFRADVKEHAYNASTGEKLELPFNAYNTVPVDLDGDGYHEFACAIGEQADRKVYNISGEVIADLGEKAYLAIASKFINLPGEQLLCYYPDGTIKIWADKNAKDSDVALKRYNSPYYKLTQKLTATGNNLINLGGL
ncbi:rhamnogalacturonan lyase family protein [Kriegella aquimaris]|uniref:Rhamnogalacturonan lyase family 11 C-terminal domain-containing protein n=1 Tax=Kriegella aquimaris TaxID=192904 RepID=A0A1G9J6I8_9FLAO|nr:hypothetical protein [Kriegella aquimaris]SDL32845.1 hypothetical protein SAMN04488514_101417 [Kriegella aquimaris]